MRLFLMRHATPVEPDIDPSKPLSDEGLREVASIATMLASMNEVEPSVIIHSDRLRAAQTADNIALKLGPPEGTKVEDGLGPDDPVEEWVDSLNEMMDDVMIVGHQPFMGKLAMTLTSGETDGWDCRFETAEVACLQRLPGGAWKLLWHRPPDRS